MLLEINPRDLAKFENGLLDIVQFLRWRRQTVLFTDRGDPSGANMAQEVSTEKWNGLPEWAKRLCMEDLDNGGEPL